MQEYPQTGNLDRDYMEVKDLISVLRRRKWLLIFVTAFAATAAFVISLFMTPVYEASTTLLIDHVSDPQRFDYNALLASERLAQTYAQMLTNRPVLQEALSRLEINMDLEDLENAIDVRPVLDTQLIELNVESTDKQLATDLANTVVQVFIKQNKALQASRFASSEASLRAQLDLLTGQIQANEVAIDALDTSSADSQTAELNRLQAELAQHQTSFISLLQSYEELRIAEARTISNIIQVELAEPPEEPVRPRPVLYALLAGVVGGMIALGVVFLIEYLDDTIRTPEDVERIFEAPILGFIAETKALGKANQGQLLLADESPPAVTEAFHSLRTNLEFLGHPGGPRAILVSSIGHGEGTTTVAAHLAASIAKSGKRVVLVDADLRRPGVHRFFGLSNGVGLSDLLRDDMVPQVATQELGSHRFKVITSGSKADSPIELFSSMWLLKVLTNLRELSDVIVFDGPPFFDTESIVLASKLEGVLIVAQPGRTRSAVAKSILEQLTRAQANVLGVVLNRVPRNQLYAARYLNNDRELAREDNQKPRLRKEKKPAERAPRTKRKEVVLRRSEPDG